MWTDTFQLLVYITHCLFKLAMKTINSQAQNCTSGRYNSPNPSTGQNTGSVKNTDYVHVSIYYSVY